MLKHVVLQTDFGLSDGAVSAMYGVAKSVDPSIQLFDLTHDISPYNIWEASYRLYQTMSYWPEETVFVSVVDPGVGTDRLSVVVKTNRNQYIVTPDNGTLTHVKGHIGIKEVRIIDEKINRLPRSGESHTFHGRDIYAYTAARLSTGVIRYEEVGPKRDEDRITCLKEENAAINKGIIRGCIDILDVRFGNVWTNINRRLLVEADHQYGDRLYVTISHHQKDVYKNKLLFVRSFAETHLGEPLLYINSLDKAAIALNQGSFAKAYHIGTGTSWGVFIQKVDE
ncbi:MULTISPECIES: S-adenosyl-l-methionine hydroxide adenosyltransferase family protein [Virgibacillus]|uniref:Adenosyl-chloride synthase n=1 Tax=Virgibacillus dokdonensis TaxID=302167 RepID=A0A2K9J1U2_9BACI|nr:MULTISPECIES: S-adenosyl-l-methionine hydroxide adenosyltransferase family protein [Virgibacillus]AUJ25645.1 Adenosyl-chloride synthase [Virgibacillus dokdonensis]NWO12143.1 S-adenosyl-l-methionine hydroxide adenosyltransferase family protein [Virgibacillus sp.]